MTAVLLTGMSGTGKSTVIGELARRGFAAVDTDDGGFIEAVAVEGQVEPPLRADATVEIDTRIPVDEVAERVLAVAAGPVDADRPRDRRRPSRPPCG